MCPLQEEPDPLTRMTANSEWYAFKAPFPQLTPFVLSAILPLPTTSSVPAESGRLLNTKTTNKYGSSYPCCGEYAGLTPFTVV